LRRVNRMRLKINRETGNAEFISYKLKSCGLDYDRGWRDERLYTGLSWLKLNCRERRDEGYFGPEWPK
jgi:hypothetical protein